MLEQGDVVALEVPHHAAHAGKALAKPEIVSRVVLGWFAFGPIPFSSILNIDHVDGVVAHNGPPFLQAQIVDAAEVFSKTCGAIMAEPTESTRPASSPSTARLKSWKSNPAARPMTAPLNMG